MKKGKYARSANLPFMFLFFLSYKNNDFTIVTKLIRITTTLLQTSFRKF
jgi:hypothetical protein